MTKAAVYEIGSNFGLHLICLSGFCKGLSSDTFHPV